MVTGSGKKEPRGIDEGFCLSYYHLSYRRKFIRTLWLMLFSPVMLFLPLPVPAMWFAVVIILGILQAGYNYWKWQTKEKP